MEDSLLLRGLCAAVVNKGGLVLARDVSALRLFGDGGRDDCRAREEGRAVGIWFMVEVLDWLLGVQV